MLIWTVNVFFSSFYFSCIHFSVAVRKLIKFYFILGVSDPYEHGRGLILADFNGNGTIDIAYGNWNGPHRLCMHTIVNGKSHFRVCTANFLLAIKLRDKPS